MTSSPWKYFFLHNLGRSFHIWWQIEASLNGLNFPKLLPDWCQNNFWTRKDIKIMSGSWKMHNTKGYILSFWSTFYLKNWRSFGNFKIWPIFRPDDVINDVTNTKNYTDLARYKIHIPVKFGVHCSNGATCIVNITDKQTDWQTNRQTNILAKIITIEIHTFSFKEMHLKVSSAKWSPGLNMLKGLYSATNWNDNIIERLSI